MAEVTEWGVRCPGSPWGRAHVSPAAGREHAEAVAASTNEILARIRWPGTATVVQRTVTTTPWTETAAFTQGSLLDEAVTSA